MTKLFPHVAGNTQGCHQTFLQKLTKKGAKVVDLPEKSNVIIVFCPIVSRYETDIQSALSSIPESGRDREVILVAMHHTFNNDYTLPNQRERDDMFLVDCLFWDAKGLLSCPCNKNAVKMVCEKLRLGNDFQSTGCWGCLGMKRDRKEGQKSRNKKNQVNQMN